MNSIILLGRTTSSIELKQTQAGKSVATFSLAVKRPYTKDATDFLTTLKQDPLTVLFLIAARKLLGGMNSSSFRGQGRYLISKGKWSLS